MLMQQLLIYHKLILFRDYFNKFTNVSEFDFLKFGFEFGNFVSHLGSYNIIKRLVFAHFLGSFLKRFLDFCATADSVH